MENTLNFINITPFQYKVSVFDLVQEFVTVHTKGPVERHNAPKDEFEKRIL